MKNIWTILGTILGILSITAMQVSAAGFKNPVTGEQPINPLFIIIPAVAIIIGVAAVLIGRRNRDKNDPPSDGGSEQQ
ncbi:MAG: hypothetical protein HFE85_02115 [Clostridiales bacterium]|nr:hypothetical protein [Clostridiales bacterium]